MRSVSYHSTLCDPQQIYCTPQFIGTAFLLIVVCAITDRKNGPPPPGLVPLVLFITILGIGAALGMQTGQLLVYSHHNAVFANQRAQATQLIPRAILARDFLPRWLATAEKVGLSSTTPPTRF